MALILSAMRSLVCKFRNPSRLLALFEVVCLQVLTLPCRTLTLLTSTEQCFSDALKATDDQHTDAMVVSVISLHDQQYTKCSFYMIAGFKTVLMLQYVIGWLPDLRLFNLAS